MTNEKFDGTSKIIVGGIVNRYELEEFYNILETEKKNFDNYIIAYIDFLGIKEKMKNDRVQYLKSEHRQYVPVN